MDTALHVTSCDLLRQLVEMYGGSLFPHLQSLHMSMAHVWDREIANSPAIKLVTGSALLSVKIEDHRSNRELNVAIEALARNSPYLRHFTLGYCTDPDWDDRVFTPVCGMLRELRVIRLCDTGIETWRSLADCPYLEEATITEAVDSDADSDDTAGPLVVLPSLQKLEIHRPSISHTVLDQTTMPSLRQLSASAWPGVIARLAEQSRYLQSLELDLWWEDMQDDQDIRAAVALSQLRVLKIGGCGMAVNVTDLTVELLAKALHCLEELSIVYHGPGEEITTIHSTGRSLSVLSQHCLSLARLELSMDLSDCPPTTSAIDLTSASLKELTLGFIRSPSDAHRAARFLAESCPNVLHLPLGHVRKSYLNKKLREDLVGHFNAFRTDVKYRAGFEGPSAFSFSPPPATSSNLLLP